MISYITRLRPAEIFLSVGLLAGASLAQAGPMLVGDSNSSTFSNTSPCSGCDAATVVLPGEGSGGTDSTLEIVDTSFSTSTDTTDLLLASLSFNLGNKPSASVSISFDYNLVLTFTFPSGGTSQTFMSTLTGNGDGGGNASVAFSGLDLILTDPGLSGVTLSNFNFLALGGDSTFNDLTNTWTINDKTADPRTLALYADVTFDSVGQNNDPAGVPTPATLALFGVGLAGLGWSRRKQNS
jgi:hypothetical protein